MKNPILLGILVVTGLFLFYHSIEVILLSLIGIGIGVVMAPLLSLLRRRYKIPRALSALLCLLIIFLFVGATSYALWFLVADQVSTLFERLPVISTNLKSRLSFVFARYPWLLNQIETLSLADTVQEIITQFFKGLNASIAALSGFLFSLILSLYVAVSLRDYFSTILQAFPPKHREKAERVLSRCASTLRLWFRAQLTDMVILGILTSLSLWAIGVDYWAIYGMLTAIFGIIPYVGTLLVVICASLITLSSDPSLVPWVIGVFILIQQIEGNIILPLLMKGQVELPEAPLLIFILLFGSWLGLMGIFLAPPVFAVLRVLYIELYLPYIDAHEIPG